MMDWLNDPALQAMDPLKKELFLKAASQLDGKSGNAMASSLMSLITAANKKGIRFSNDEIAFILNVMKQGKTAQEKQQIDSMTRMVSHMLQKGRH